MRTAQIPIQSGFNAASTAAEVMRGIDLSGRNVILTGGYSGLGKENARVFAAAGARVIVPARDVDRAKSALLDLPNVEVWPMDLLDPASIDAFAERFLGANQPLHVLVNSAGIMANPLTRDARGYESQFATNHLGHFQLTVRLWPALIEAAGARIVSVSSLGHRYSPVVFEDPNFEHREYDPWKAYGQSKTANILFAVALDDRGRQDGIRAFSCHPGSIVSTGLGKHLSKDQLISAGVLDADGNPILDPSRNLKTVEQGAATQVWCATSPQLDRMGGVYCENAEVAEVIAEQPDQPPMNTAMIRFGVRRYAIDPDSAERLWTLSEILTGVKG